MGEAETEDEINDQLEADFSERYQRRLSVGAMKLLLAFAYYGPETQYSLAKLTDMRYASVHSTINILCKLGLTVKTATQESEKGVETYLYWLTEQGVLSLLSRVPTAIPDPLMHEWQEGLDPAKDISNIKNLKSHKDIYFHLSFELDTDKIAKTCATHFPLVFGKWSLLKHINICSEFQLPEIAFQALTQHYFKYAREKSLSRDFAHKFYTYNLKLMIGLDDPKESQKTRQEITKLLKDPELGKLLKRISREILTSLKSQIRLLSQACADV